MCLISAFKDVFIYAIHDGSLLYNKIRHLLINLRKITHLLYYLWYLLISIPQIWILLHLLKYSLIILDLLFVLSIIKLCHLVDIWLLYWLKLLRKLLELGQVCLLNVLNYLLFYEWNPLNFGCWSRDLLRWVFSANYFNHSITTLHLF